MMRVTTPPAAIELMERGERHDPPTQPAGHDAAARGGTSGGAGAPRPENRAAPAEVNRAPVAPARPPISLEPPTTHRLHGTLLNNPYEATGRITEQAICCSTTWAIAAGIFSSIWTLLYYLTMRDAFPGFSDQSCGTYDDCRPQLLTSMRTLQHQRFEPALGRNITWTSQVREVTHNMSADAQAACVSAIVGCMTREGARRSAYDADFAANSRQVSFHAEMGVVAGFGIVALFLGLNLFVAKRCALANAREAAAGRGDA